MPCGDYSDSDTIHEQSKKILALTRIACDLLNHISRNLVDSLSLRKETRDWIKAHVKEDQERRRREQADREERYAKSQALKKLTPEERKLLGV